MAELGERMTSKPCDVLSFLLRARPLPGVLSLWAGNAVARAALFQSIFSFENANTDRKQVLIFGIQARTGDNQSGNWW
jgi:hypothetical protein